MVCEAHLWVVHMHASMCRLAAGSSICQIIKAELPRIPAVIVPAVIIKAAPSIIVQAFLHACTGQKHCRMTCFLHCSSARASRLFP